MCGIFGLLGKLASCEKSKKGLSLLSHRGPDGEGQWHDHSRRVFFGHRRLAIIDVSSNGDQPMVSNCGRFVVIFNGEIYNHTELRERLKCQNSHISWRGHSDTETLVVAIQTWGFEYTLKQLNGMFAFAVWDNKYEQLLIARDRVGEKPLYYGNFNDGFGFTSELKAFNCIPNWDKELDRSSLTKFLRHGYICAPSSIYSNIRKLKPGHFVVVDAFGKYVSEQTCYWNLLDITKKDTTPLVTGDTKTTVNLVEQQLYESVNSRLLSDVPVGAFLSGGIDSSLIVALMQKLSLNRVKTFSIGFEENNFNEAPFAKSVAKHLGTEHHEFYVSPSECLDVIPQLPEIYDEPFADSSQIPTYLVSKLARQNVKVALSGDGGDEFFCGYNRYNLGYKIWKSFNICPYSIRRLISSSIKNSPKELINFIGKIAPKNYRASVSSDKALKLAEVLQLESPQEFYFGLISTIKNPCDYILNIENENSMFDDVNIDANNMDFRDQMMLFDSLTYLPDDILTKVDRASMSVSLESRAPFLDHDLIELVSGIDINVKTREGKSKWVLREILNKHVPQQLIDRPKMGFGVPIEQWLRGPLEDWVEHQLSFERLDSEGYFDAKKVRELWHQHKSGERRWHYGLWNILMFQAWVEAN